MSPASAVAAEEVRALQRELADGGTPTVWFTSAAVGVQEGKSGKVITLDEPAEGDFIQVRPAGSKDVLSFSAAEVTVVKPPRKRKEPDSSAKGSGPRARSHGTGGGTQRDTGTQRHNGTQRESEARQPAAASRTSSAARSSATSRSSTGGGSAGGTGAKRKPRQPSPATVTLTADQAGQWSVEVSSGKKRLLRPRTVPASAVAQAAKALHEEVAEAVEPLIEAARAEQQARIERLQQELAEAQRMLDELG